MAESGQYDDATLARQKIAAQLLAGTLKPEENIKSWSQGLANMAKAGIGGYMGYQANEEAKAQREAGKGELYAALGLPPPAAAATPPSTGLFDRIGALLGGGGGDASAPAPAPPMAGPASIPSTPGPAPIQSAPMPPVATPPVVPPSPPVASPTPPPAPAAPPRTPVEPLGDVVRTNPDGTIAGNITSPTIPAPSPPGAGKVAAALTAPPPSAPAGGPAVPQVSLPASPTGGALGDIPTDKKVQIAKMLTSRNPTVQAMGQTLLSNYTKADAPTDETKEYKLAQSQGYKGTFVDFKTDLKKAGATKVEQNVGGGTDKQIFDEVSESAKAARTTAAGLTGLREARNAIKGGIISGAGADTMLGLQKVGAAIGVTDPDRIVNTETFRAAIAPQVASVLRSTVGTANISNTDREFAEKAAGGNITLDEKSISRLLDIMERASTKQLNDHQKRVETVYADPEKYKRERALFGVDMPAEPEMAAPASAAPAGAVRKFNPATGKIE